MKHSSVLLLSFALWLAAVSVCMAQPQGLLVVVLLPGTNLADWRRADAPTLHRLMAEGALAVMNTRTARLPNDHTRETPQSAALTLGAGSRAAGGPEATDFQPMDTSLFPSVTAGQLYTRRMGLIAPSNSLINVHWPRVIRANQDRGYDIHLGNLTDGLAAHGISAYAVGPMADAVACSSVGAVTFPPGMNSWAIAPPGLKSGAAEEQTVRLRGRRQATDTIPRPRRRAILSASAPDVIPGDWAGGFSLGERALLVGDAGNDLRTADRTLSNLVGLLTRAHGRLIVLSSSVSDAEYARGERLAPVVLWGEGVAPGLLYSPSTHRAGLVTNTDFAPTVTAYFGATLSVKSFGGVWEVRPAANAEMTVSRLEAQAYQQSRAMRLLPYLALVLGVCSVLGTLGWFRGRPVPALFLFPIALVFALIGSSSIVAFCVWLTVTLTLLLIKRGGALIGISAIVLLLVADMCLGDPLMGRGMLGYSAVEGARYYGIGNEAMGALIGASLVVAACAWRPDSRWRNGFVVCGLAAIALLLGSPLAGAKAGGLLVAVGSFGALLWKLRGGTLNARAVIIALGAAALALGMMALLDLHGGGQQTHMGRAVSRILGGGWGEAGDIIRRKLAVEGRLLYHSAWAVPLWGSVFGLAVVRQKIRIGNRQTQALWQAGWVAVALCLAVNDAGVVAAALCAALLWSGLMAAQTQNSPRRKEAKIAPREAGRE